MRICDGRDDWAQGEERVIFDRGGRGGRLLDGRNGFEVRLIDVWNESIGAEAKNY